MSKLTAWQKKCERVAKETGVDVFFCEESGPTETRAFEDDGCLHVTKAKDQNRACFDIGQDRPAKEQNERITKVLTALGMEKSIAANLMDETEDEDGGESCPCCGREY